MVLEEMELKEKEKIIKKINESRKKYGLIGRLKIDAIHCCDGYRYYHIINNEIGFEIVLDTCMGVELRKFNGRIGAYSLTKILDFMKDIEKWNE